MHVGLAVADGFFAAGVTSVLDLLHAADAIRADVDPTIPSVGVEVVGSAPTATSGTGVSVPVAAPLDDLDRFDVVVIGAPGTVALHDTVRALHAPGVAAVVEVAGDLSGRRPVAAACTGTFVLAESGALDGRRATTSWWLDQGFRHRYPAVDLDPDAVVVADGPVTTAGAAFGHVDLALHLLRGHSPLLAQAVAARLVVDHRPAPSSQVAADHLTHADPVVSAFEGYARRRLDHRIDIDAAARSIGVGRRTLERRLDRATGLSPLAFVQRMRVDRARHLMATTDQSAQQVARRVGYANASTLRSVLRRQA